MLGLDKLGSGSILVVLIAGGWLTVQRVDILGKPDPARVVVARRVTLRQVPARMVGLPREGDRVSGRREVRPLELGLTTGSWAE